MKLHLGCGKRDFGNDWVHIDGGEFNHIQSHDIINLDYKNVDVIYASHVLEYFDRDEAKEVLLKWIECLKDGGILRLAVPDFECIAQLYTSKQYPLSSFLGPLYGKMDMGDEKIYHKTVYDYNSLKSLLITCGFKNVRRYNWRETEHSHIDDHSQAYLPHMDKEQGRLISLNVEAEK